MSIQSPTTTHHFVVPQVREILFGDRPIATQAELVMASLLVRPVVAGERDRAA